MDREDHKWFLILSNLAYLIPVFTLYYKMYAPQYRMNREDGWELILLFLFITFFSSWSYHACRADLSADTVSVDAQINNPCTDCPHRHNSISWVEALPGSSDPLSYQMSKFIDYFFALFVLLMVIIHVVPISEKFRKLFMVFSLIWIILFLAGGNEAFAAIPVILALLLLLVFWQLIRNHSTQKTGYTRNRAWGLSLISAIAAAVFFVGDTEPYWLKHSLWHILSAIAAAFLISKTAGCYQEIDTFELQVPDWMQSIFIQPHQCSALNKLFPSS